jgi:orotidine-5'-phosphate decarboxylase
VIASGANWIIVGRSIYNSECPKETAMELVTGIGI